MRTREITLDDALADYAAIKEPAVSPRSWYAIKIFLGNFRDWMIDQTYDGVTLDVVCDPEARYISSYLNKWRGSAPGTFNNRRVYMRGFIMHCLGEAWINVNPIRHVPAAKVIRRPKTRLGAQELMMLLEEAPPRERIALAIGMNTALRGGDIMTLKVGDVDLYSDTINAWIEKSDAYEALPITADLRQEILIWFEHLVEHEGLDSIEDIPNSWTLVPPRRTYWDKFPGRNPDAKLLWKYRFNAVGSQPHQIVQDALKRIGITPVKGDGMHTLRKAAARVMYDAAEAAGHNDPTRIVQVLLKHKSRDMTERYLEKTPEQKKRDTVMRGKSFISAAAQRERAMHEGGDNATRTSGPVRLSGRKAS